MSIRRGNEDHQRAISWDCLALSRNTSMTERRQNFTTVRRSHNILCVPKNNSLAYWLVIITLAVSLRHIVICENTTVGDDNTTEINESSPNFSYILKQLLKDYDKLILPYKSDGKATEVQIGVYMQDMVPLERMNMHYSMDIYFRQYWKDDRLSYERYIPEHMQNQFESIVLDSNFLSKIWVPDIYFPSVKRGNRAKLTKSNELIRIHKNGQVFYSMRLHLTTFCMMDLSDFPFDHQECIFTIGSYGYDNQRLTLSWLGVNNAIIPPNFKDMFEFTFDSLEYDKKETNYGFAGIYDDLQIHFHFSRNINYYLLQIYLPCCLIVILSWVGFWIDYRSTPARVALGITTVLTMITFSISIRSSLPFVSYTRLIDVYLLVCFVYVFMALVEYAVVGITDQKWKKKLENLTSSGGNKNVNAPFPPKLTRETSTISMGSIMEERDCNGDELSSASLSPPWQNGTGTPPWQAGNVTPRSAVGDSDTPRSVDSKAPVISNGNGILTNHFQTSPRDLENGDAFVRSNSIREYDETTTITSTSQQAFNFHRRTNGTVLQHNTNVKEDQKPKYQRGNGKRLIHRTGRKVSSTGRKVSRTLFERQKKNKEIHVIDKISRYLYPSVFITFNIIYFAYAYAGWADNNDDH